ncbi:MAG TPA: hypothetical protein PK080_00090 [Hyphomonadaceae bacterium]|nr:hypothetical protein [Hyphomonadaceae bacterium]
MNNQEQISNTEDRGMLPVARSPDEICVYPTQTIEEVLPWRRFKSKPASDPGDGLLFFDGMGSLPADFRGLQGYLLIAPGNPGKEAFRFCGESWREKRRPQRNKRNKN